MLIEQLLDFMRRESNREQTDKQFDRTAERIIAELKSPLYLLHLLMVVPPYHTTIS